MADRLAADKVMGRLRDDFRRGSPIILTDAGEALLVGPVESGLSLSEISKSFDAHLDLVISNRRAETLHIAHKGMRAVRLRLPAGASAADVNAIADPSEDLSSPLRGPFEIVESGDSKNARAALMLARAAGFLPAAVVANLDGGSIDQISAEQGVLTGDSTELMAWLEAAPRRIVEVARARVPLAGAEDARLILFRPGDGGAEHVALVIGSPSFAEPVYVRVHSQCFTGDLLQSLKCDCGDQLRGAVSRLADLGGGILVYLAQEGRGIGLAAKIKAYGLQDQGFDTVDANLRLGFEMDERAFAPAARILELLGVRRVRLLTNNPAKVAGLEAEGVDVVERVPHSFPPTPFSADYLQVKKSRAGHLL